MKLCYWMYAGPAHIGTLRVASSFKNVHAIMHAPLGDDYFNVMRAMLERERDFTPATQTVVDRHVLARGSQDKVIDTIIRKDQEDHPDLIILTPTCTSSILQEDLQNFADRSNETTACPVLLADVNHYRYNEFEATDRVLAQIVRQFVPPPTGSPWVDKTVRPSVNIIGSLGLGFHHQHDLNELLRLLHQLKIDVNMMVPQSIDSQGHTSELPGMTRAWVNIVPYRETGSLTAQYLSREWDMPYIATPPQGLSYLTEWIRELAKALSECLNALEHTDGSPLDDTQNRACLQRWIAGQDPCGVPSGDGLEIAPGIYNHFIRQQIQNVCAGSWFVHTIDCQNLVRKKAFVFGDSTHAAAMTRFLREDMGIHVAAAGTFCKYDETWFRAAVDGLAETVFVTDDNTRVSTLIAHLQPDAIFGTQMERHIGKRLGIPCSVISAPVHIQNYNLSYTPFFGYEGVNHMADLVYNTFALGMEDHLLDMFGGHDQESNTTEETSPVASLASNPSEPTWSPEAQAILQTIPGFIRQNIMTQVTTYAKAHKITHITPECMLAAKQQAGA